MSRKSRLYSIQRVPQLSEQHRALKVGTYDVYGPGDGHTESASVLPNWVILILLFQTPAGMKVVVVP